MHSYPHNQNNCLLERLGFQNICASVILSIAVSSHTTSCIVLIHDFTVIIYTTSLSHFYSQLSQRSNLSSGEFSAYLTCRCVEDPCEERSVTMSAETSAFRYVPVLSRVFSRRFILVFLLCIILLAWMEGSFYLA